jgi:hypothetical protein
MRTKLTFSFCFIATFTLLCPCLLADVVLTFDQSGIFDSVAIDQNYGDRVTSSPDVNGHSYDIIAGNGFGLTPNVEVEYTAGEADLWTTGYGDLTNVLYDELDFEDGFEVIFTADPGFEVGIFGFDIAAFDSETTIPGIDVLDGDNNVLWSVGSTAISETARNSFDTGGVFAESLTIAIDLTGLNGASDNIGIDNIHFAQQAIPEPATASLVGLSLIGLLSRRRM